MIVGILRHQNSRRALGSPEIISSGSSTGVAVTTAILLGATDCPNSGGYDLYTRQQPTNPILFYILRILVDRFCDHAAVYRQGHIANAEHGTSRL